MPDEKDPFDRSFDSLEALADTISDVLQCPITIEDSNHRLIAYSSHDPHTDQVRVATIIGRRVPEKVISTLWRDGVIQKIMESDEPVRVSPINDIGLGHRLAVAIRKNNDILGYIWLLEEQKQLDDNAIQQVKKAALAAKTKLLQLQLKKRKEEMGYQDFFWQLLTGHLHSDIVIKEKADKLGMNLPSSFHIIVLQFEPEITESMQQQIEYILTTTQRLRIVCHTIDHNQLILLSTTPVKRLKNEDYSVALQHIIEQMRQRFGFSPVYGGIGSLYENYAMVERSYQEALAVLQIKRCFPEETRNIHYYPDMGYYRFLQKILDEARINPIENQCLKKLKQYDSEHNSELLHTLEVYLSHDSNMKAVSEILHIHANTLSYRLKRISEIGGIDLNSMDQKVTVYLDLKTEKLRSM
ncbi:PucR family transcriptional regulator [Paenibacillus radicis (ex Xue et al. 2023)]|uniref:PucR family transcriptional regulator n=1 Tax=Paenibacillus radicis (ex Xue et al. 2023) TaxID=2972489 RepID=A0ABT1YQ18_9BACL|nr:PucR family transcriptional regulator [Paenibacillus radicis (ex Xue et al. 2023)]MCR8635273.1 PucR family transcriptional regulator [Paenibacillus radicis (ex Xue et al. 2023)]